MIAALALVAMQAATPGAADNPVANLPPASAAAVRAGVKACVGATVDPAGQNARLAGWTDAVRAPGQTVRSDGRIVQRDNVMVMVKPGIDGGCVVMANLAPDFDRPAFFADLARDIGTAVVTDPKNPVTDLGKGEVLVTTFTDAPKPMAILVVGNTNGTAVKNKGKE